MKIILAPQALKGSLDAEAVGQAMAEGVRIALPDAEIAIIPVADGGEGTVRALVAATDGQLLHTRVTGPLGEPVEAEWGLLGTGTHRARRKDRRDRDGRRRWPPARPAGAAQSACHDDLWRRRVAARGAGRWLYAHPHRHRRQRHE